ncbi:ALP1-like protein isoform X1 [Tanacetum coccineum]|uniref:ALP1-like protein isoform X1 n=1 Tax=Tanacetum coccineum TaxID=301880 RepID=A0ABQ5HIF3_9ASTR
MSSIGKFDVEKFDESNDFGLWRVKMWCLLIQQGVEGSQQRGFYRGSLVKVGNFSHDKALMLLTSLSSSYDNFVETLLYGRESLTLKDVLSTLNSRGLKKKTDAKDDGDRLFKDCPKRNKKKSTSFIKKNARQGSGMHSEDYNNGDLLMAVSKEMFLEWIMYSGGSYHKTPMRDFLFDFREFSGGTIFLGDNRACAIKGTRKGAQWNREAEVFQVSNDDAVVAQRRLKDNQLEEKTNMDCLGQYDRGDKKYPTIMLEAVALQDLWIWHSFFGVASANNNINVLDNSPLFDDLLDDKAPVAPYVVNGDGFEKRYYLADGIYPQWATFVKSFTVENDAKHAYFKKRQESAQKDVEHAFGVLQGQDPKMTVLDWNEVYANPSRNMQRTWVERCETQRQKNKEMRDREMHLSLQQNLMEHIWQQVDHKDEDEDEDF